MYLYMYICMLLIRTYSVSNLTQQIQIVFFFYCSTYYYAHRPSYSLPTFSISVVIREIRLIKIYCVKSYRQEISQFMFIVETISSPEHIHSRIGILRFLHSYTACWDELSFIHVCLRVINPNIERSSNTFDLGFPYLVK